MKKLNLNVTNLNATEILSREELKQVLGAEGSGDGLVTTCTEYNEGSACILSSYWDTQKGYVYTKGTCAKSFLNGVPIYICR